MTDAKVQDNNMECDNAGNEHEINVKKVSRWFFSRHRFVDFTEMFLVAGLNEQIWKVNNVDKELMKLDYYSRCIYSLETESHQFDNVVATGGTSSCHNDKVVELTVFCFQCYVFFKTNPCLLTRAANLNSISMA